MLWRVFEDLLGFSLKGSVGFRVVVIGLEHVIVGIVFQTGVGL